MSNESTVTSSKAPLDSPALKLRSNSYPVVWKQRVPKRVAMRHSVKADFPFLLKSGLEEKMVAYSGQEYPCYVNSHGAVSLILPIGELLGVKPDEFEVIEWHEVG